MASGTAAFVNTNELIVTLFACLGSPNDLISLMQTCRRFHDIGRRYQQTVLRGVAQSAYLPEAIAFFDLRRPYALDPLSRRKFEYNLSELGLKRSGWRWQFLGTESDSYTFGRKELSALATEDEKVDLIVDKISRNIDLTAALDPDNYDGEGEVIRNQAEEPMLDEEGKLSVKKAVYQLLLLLGQFRVTGVKGIENHSSLSREELLKKEDSDLVWSYDYTFAANLSAEELFKILALARFVRFYDWEVVTETPNFDKFPGKEILHCNLPVNVPARDRDLCNASIKRFAYVNLLNLTENRKAMQSLIDKVFSSCINDAYLFPDKWQRSIQSLEKWRAISGSTASLRFSEGYNTRIFEKRELSVLNVDGKFYPETLLVVKDNGWQGLTEVEAALINGHRAEPWMISDMVGPGPRSGSDDEGSDDSDAAEDAHLSWLMSELAASEQRSAMYRSLGYGGFSDEEEEEEEDYDFY
ncbi:hypothetical protein BJ508DRAFT_348806 [Ascobolus immersus RN42]|uniref:F-box domain-containing protein n=1 Tax=Ascobolus immersus RN42 TaxID=1160509 RepID=A0A3N4IXI9_ASCIM|nr:hypothetical protein BJ508DRAFT_348806 [Ascobolus immersus RN42]